MAIVISQTLFPFSTSQDVAVTTWPALAAGDSGEPVALGVYSDRTVQVAGVFDGAAVLLQGSNNGTDYHTLTDPQGNALSFTTAGLEAVIELPVYLRPFVQAGGASTALSVIVSGRRSI